MFVSCKDVLRLPALKKAQIVAGEEGLNRSVTWVHVVELPNVQEWVNSGELIFITGVGLKNIEKDLINIIHGMNDKNAAGLFIEVGPYIQEIPEKVINIANELELPIFQIPFELKVIDITQSICRLIFNNYSKERSMNELMKEILYGDFSEEIGERAVFYGYDAEKKYRAMIVDINKFSQYIEKENIKDENIIIELKSVVENIIKDTCNKYNKKILYVTKSDSYTVMVPLSDKLSKNGEVYSIADEIREKISKNVKGLTVNIGIGNSCNELKDFKRSVSQALKSLKILKACKRIDSTREYKELGVYRLLFKIDDIDELRNICEEVLGALIEQDKKNGTDFLNTLEVFLREDRNLGKTAEVLFVHRNTMKYRLARIEEILQCDLENANVCFNISLAYKIKRFINLS